MVHIMPTGTVDHCLYQSCSFSPWANLFKASLVLTLGKIQPSFSVSISTRPFHLKLDDEDKIYQKYIFKLTKTLLEYLL